MNKEHLAMLHRRLARLKAIRARYTNDLNPLGLRLLDRAIQATLLDILDC